MSETDKLRQRFIAFRKAQKQTLRQMEGHLKISNAFLSQFENGSGIDFEKACTIDKFMKEVGEPMLCQACGGKGWQ